MLSFIKSIFPRRVKSMDQFVEILRRKGCISVLIKVEGTMHEWETPRSLYWDYEHALKLTAITILGRNVVYREFLLGWSEYLETPPSGQEMTLQKAGIKACLLGERKMQELQAMLPNVAVRLVLGDISFDDALFNELHCDAITVGVAI